MNFDIGLYNNFDFEAIKILREFLPDRIFDAHAHTFDCDFVPGIRGAYVKDRTTSEDYVNFLSELLCNPKEIRLNLIF